MFINSHFPLVKECLLTSLSVHWGQLTSESMLDRGRGGVGVRAWELVGDWMKA